MALDGGHEVQVILVHDRQARELKNFAPGKYEELNGKAFRGRLGEFTFTTVQTEEMAGKADLLSDMLQVIGHQEGVKRLMLIVADQQLDSLRPLLKRIDSDSRRTTVFTMQPSRSEHQTVVSDAGPSDSFAYGLGTMSYSLPSSASILYSSSYATR